MMKNADAQLPMANSQTVARWTRRREPVPAEDPEPEERRLEHERREPLDRERRAEHVAHELRVDRPVHPELELLHEPRRDTDREVDQHQRPEEAGQPEPGLVAAAVPERLHHRDERSEPERQRDEQEVVERGRGELDPREIDRRHRQGAHCADHHDTLRALGPPMPWPSAVLARSRSTEWLQRSFDRGVEPGELVLDRLPVLRQHPLAQVLEQRSQPPHDLDRRAPVQADLRDRSLRRCPPSVVP